LRQNRFAILPRFLSACCEEELVSGAAWSSQSEPVQLQDALEMGKQHLDLLSLTT